MHARHRHQSLNARILNENEDAVVALLAKHRAECAVLTGTEGKDGNALRAPGWGVFREPGDFNRGDPWISWATDVWQIRDGHVEELSGVTYDGRRAHAAVARLRHLRTERRVTFIVPHLPAHVGRLIRTRRVDSRREDAYHESLASLREIVRGVRRDHPNSRVVLVGDVNLDVRTHFARRLFDNALRDTGLHMVPVSRGERGTHGRRLIDWAFTDLASSGDVLERTDASDHRGVAFIHED